MEFERVDSRCVLISFLILSVHVSRRVGMCGWRGIGFVPGRSWWRLVAGGFLIGSIATAAIFLAILSLVLFERLPRLPLGQVWWALVPTILYGLYDLHGNITGAIDGPYPFMRVYDQTIQKTLIWFTIILVTNLLYAFLLWWLGGNGRKSKVGLEFRT